MSKVSSLVNCSDVEEVECLNDFVESIQNEMSVQGECEWCNTIYYPC